MKPKELYDIITQYMTPEQALLKLLEGHVLTYEKLKFNEGEEIHPMMLVSMAAMDMGWNICFKNPDEDEEVDGMVIGTDDYTNNIFNVDDDTQN